MTIDEALRLIAGTFVLLSLLLGYFVHPGWFLFTGFVALNLMQSAFTRWCPMITILRKAGLREAR
ncbi:MAG: YgaP family membrane protein [Pseudomonadota bacterium]